jgi:glycosyltransferase involved in cell wall biosynthesis
MMPTKPQRILIVDHHAIHPSGRALYRTLAAIGEFELRVLSPDVWREYGVTTNFSGMLDAADEASERLSIVSSKTLFNGKPHRLLYCGLMREVQSFHPDLLLVNSEPEGFLAMQALLSTMRTASKPALLLTTWRNMPYGEPGVPFPVKLSWLCSFIERIVLPRAAHVVALSPSSPEIFARQGFTRISHIPPWVDQDIFNPGDAEDGPHGTQKGPLHVGYVGRFVPEKGILTLLDACEMTGLPLEVTLLGDGPQQQQLDARIGTLRMDVHVRIKPSVPHEQVPATLRSFDVVVLPSTGRRGWTEQFGRVLIEAMACGVPVIGSASGAIPDIIGDAGIVVPPGDVTSLAAALSRLSANAEERSRLRLAGLNRVSSLFSVAAVADRHADLFRSLLSTRPPHDPR